MSGRRTERQMWYPEEPVTYCEKCEEEIPVECLWRGRGSIIGGSGRETRTSVLYSQCPECGHRLSVGLDGPWWFRVLYAWLWKLRYPGTRQPIFRLPVVEPRNRRVPGG